MARAQSWADKDRALAQHANVDMTVFGVPLGQPLNLPQCQGDDSGANLGTLLTGVGTGLARTCVGDGAGSMALGITAIALSLGGVKAPSGSDVVAARLAESMCPDWVKAGGTCMLLLNVKDGIVVGASVQTSNITPSTTIEGKLQAKYHVPGDEARLHTVFEQIRRLDARRQPHLVTAGALRVLQPARRRLHPRRRQGANGRVPSGARGPGEEARRRPA
jgi:hypothetical protein